MRISLALIGLSIATAAVALPLSSWTHDDVVSIESSSGSETVDFARDIRPILSNKCFTCHGPDEATREGDFRLDRKQDLFGEIVPGVRPVVPGDPEDSEIYLRLTEPFPEDRMPPPDSGLSLSQHEIELMKGWISAGAPWEDHWSFSPPTKPTMPTVNQIGWARSDLDRLVLSRIEDAGLTPNPEADRATLIRRVSLDLTGLPPTPEQLADFLNDSANGAYERMVDRLLDSPHFGERFARLWLDLARYADTKGYEADRRRTMWPYRDWVIDAFNADMPFDAFARRQLAGDLLPDPTQDDLIATGFHRNTMTNDEGGTDDEEFRAAAVIDRTNTTMTTWMGLTMGCAQCHTHKYDPITHDDYYRFYAIFNNTADADRMDEEPKLTVIDERHRAKLDELRRQRNQIEAARLAAVNPSAYTDPGRSNGDSEAGFVPFIDDLLPSSYKQDIETPWPWVKHETPNSGSWSWTIDAGEAFLQRFFTEMFPSYTIVEGDRITTAVLLDPDHPTREIMIQVRRSDGRWLHRAYWGENLIEFGAEGTTERLRLGDLPEAGQWVVLDIPVATIGLAPGMQIDGVAFSQYAGRVSWDRTGIVSEAPITQDWKTSLRAWLDLEATRDFAGLDESLQKIADTEPSDERIVRHYLQQVHEPTRVELAKSREQINAVSAQIAAIENAGPKMPIMRELMGDNRRTTRVLEKGSYLSPAHEVSPGVPAVFADVTSDSPTNRLELADWLVNEENPLTARVTVNRLWECFFGVGIVETTDDFGTQGVLPTNPELLDWLALRFVDSGWSMKELCRTIVTSATYRQSSRASSEKRSIDPTNTLLARAPRFRLDAEFVRDSALAVAGLLSPKLGGPPVFPPQPEGVWSVVYSGDKWTTSKGEDRYRRGLYTFWRRTSPYPSMMTFDAVSREICVARRIRTNTPLQALVTLNDPVFVEAAQALARRMMLTADRPDNLRQIAASGFSLSLMRTASDAEVDELVRLFESEQERLENDAEAAAALAGAPPVDSPPDATTVDIAAWTSVALVLLNLDEFLTRP